MIWAHHSIQRILPDSAQGNSKQIQCSGARGQTIAFQIGLRPPRVIKQLRISISGSMARYASARLAGLVPLRHQTTETPADMLDGIAPCFVPDPLFELNDEALDANVSRALWISIRIPAQSKGGDLRLSISLDDETDSIDANINVWPFALPRLDLPVTNWFYSDALCDWYKVEPFSKRHWQLVQAYFQNLVDHNQTVIYTPLFTPPLDNKKRDLQLVDVKVIGKDRYQFGFSKMRKWIGLARKAGFRYFEMSHLFSQWGAAYAIRILDQNAKPLWKPQTPATHPRARRFLEQFLPALIRFLSAEKIFNRTIFHLSDEPGQKHLAQYRAVREMVRQIAPDIRTTEALSDVEFFKEGLIDRPVPKIDHVPQFLEAGIHPWAYYCCSPKGVFPNRFLDYPLYRLAILGPMLYRFGLTGFLHWGCNYWYRGGTTDLINPFQVTDAHRWPNWAAGDPFIIYPGADGPLDSIRWEIFRETFDDYRMLQLAATKVGADRVQSLLLKIESPANYPRSAEWILNLRQELAEMILKQS